MPYFMGRRVVATDDEKDTRRVELVMGRRLGRTLMRSGLGRLVGALVRAGTGGWYFGGGPVGGAGVDEDGGAGAFGAGAAVGASLDTGDGGIVKTRAGLGFGGKADRAVVVMVDFAGDAAGEAAGVSFLASVVATVILVSPILISANLTSSLSR